MREPKAAEAGRPGVGWIGRMAWRDSRGQRGVLLLFVLCIVFGIAALVAIRSLRTNLESAIQDESRGLVGADLVLRTRQPFSPELEEWLAAQGGAVSREGEFRSMARFPESGQTRFVQVRGLEPGFPFYGELETSPAEVEFRAPGAPARALVEAGLMTQYGLDPGDAVRIGEAEFTIAGALERVAGESELGGFFAPRVFVSYEALQATGLLRQGSVVSHRAYLAFEDGLTEEREAALEAARTGLFLEEGVRVTTVADRQESIERVMGNLFAYLGLVGFIALMLGGMGVGGAVQVYLQPKLAHIAVLRCLGAPASAAFLIYLAQIMAVGLGGAVLGTLLGVGVQMLLPRLIAPFLPFAVEVSLDGGSIVFGLIFGWLVASLFALRPLLPLRRVSPLRTLRADFEPTGGRGDPWQRLVSGLLVGLALGYSMWQAPEWWQGLAFAVGLAAAYAVLALGAVGLRAGLRRLRAPHWPYSVRLALSNLYRPNNRTVFLVTSLGLGAFLISTLYLARSALLAQIETRDDPDRPNVIVVDVQPDQREAVVEEMEAGGVTVQDVLPVVTMRVQGIKGEPLRVWREREDSPVDDWVYSWEFRTTFRDHVLPNATVTEGEFVGHYTGEEPIPISLSENLLNDFGVGLGDTIEWDVQGLPLLSYVSSIREVNWELGRQNFGVVWPTGVLEAAPAMFALTTQVADRAQTTELQRQLGEAFPNVSLIDLSLMFETIEDVLGRVAFVIQFMAAFTVFTALVVLFGAMVTSRYQRIRESVLLRTLGAGSGFVRSLLAAEYLLLGSLAALVGVGLSVAASAAIARWIFEIPFVLDWLPLLLVATAVIVLTLLTGWFNSRGIVREPPLRILREER